MVLAAAVTTMALAVALAAALALLNFGHVFCTDSLYCYYLYDLPAAELYCAAPNRLEAAAGSLLFAAAECRQAAGPEAPWAAATGLSHRRSAAAAEEECSQLLDRREQIIGRNPNQKQQTRCLPNLCGWNSLLSHHS